MRGLPRERSWCGSLTCWFAAGGRSRRECGAVGGRACGVLPSGGDGPGVVRRDGRILAGAWLPDLVRLGELERHLGDGVIEVIRGSGAGEGAAEEAGASPDHVVSAGDPAMIAMA